MVRILLSLMLAVATARLTAEEPPGSSARSKSDAIVINEVCRDNDGIDDREFVELCGPPGASLDTLTLIEIEGDFGVSGQQGRIDNVWPLKGLSIPADGFFLLADNAIPDREISLGVSNQIENGTATYLLIAGYDAKAHDMGTDIDEDDDGVVDAGITLGKIVDALAIVDGGINAAKAKRDRVYATDVLIGPHGSTAPAGAARCKDGVDTDSASDFCELDRSPDGGNGLAVASPGAANRCQPCTPRGDGNGDGRVDLGDFGLFQNCTTGAVGPIDPPAYAPRCACLDFENNGAIDLTDYAEFADLVGARLMSRRPAEELIVRTVRRGPTFVAGRSSR